MLFVDFHFLAFFAVVFAVHWSLRSAVKRKAWLLLASYAFYAAWDWRFCGLIFASTAFDYVAALRISSTQGRAKRAWLVGSIVVNLGVLGFFKYFGFFVDSAVQLGAWCGLELPRPSLEIVLPVGISFFTFQSMSYTLDVHRGVLTARRSFAEVALFVAFFPQLVAGPIVRARDFLPQLDEPRRFANVAVRASLSLFVAGLIKKVFFADQIGNLIDPYFADPEAYHWMSAWIAAPLFGAQIYCDFSGYSDMALGIAGLLGYQLCVNFRHPYLATSIREFWHRWHISLSTWLRDYLYIPLGGGKGSTFQTYRNLFLTMVLGGLWHGAAFTFVVWGALHGLALMIHRQWSAAVEGRWRLPPLVAWALTGIWVCLTWIYFRAADLGSATTITRAFLFGDSSGTESLSPRLFGLIAGLLGVHFLAHRELVQRRLHALPAPVFAFGLGVSAATIAWLYPASFEPFIYFQF